MPTVTNRTEQNLEVTLLGVTIPSKASVVVSNAEASLLESNKNLVVTYDGSSSIQSETGRQDDVKETQRASQSQNDNSETVA